MNTKFISVLMFQLSITEKSNTYDEYIIEDDNYKKQMDSSFECIEKFKPDIVVYPEMTYSDSYEDKLKQLSASRLIVAGSYYKNGINNTVVFLNGEVKKFVKRYASGAEPMSRRTKYVNPNNFMNDYLQEHIFEIKGEKVCILNCMEYYHVAYFIARNPDINKGIFAFVSPCSTNNIIVFEHETIAIHNHNEYIYSFVSNCISVYNNKQYANGGSYVYGPIHKHEKKWLKEEGIKSSDNPSNIVSLADEISYVYGEYANPSMLSRFGRSDFYETNPQNVTVGKINI